MNKQERIQHLNNAFTKAELYEDMATMLGPTGSFKYFQNYDEANVVRIDYIGFTDESYLEFNNNTYQFEAKVSEDYELQEEQDDDDNLRKLTQAQDLYNHIVKHNQPSISLEEIFEKYKHNCDYYGFNEQYFFFDDGSIIRFNRKQSNYYCGMKVCIDE